jgi:hypothetical protein
MLNVSVDPGSGSAVVGWNEYCTRGVAVVAGVPEIVGGLFDDATVIENAGATRRFAVAERASWSCDAADVRGTGVRCLRN